MRNLVVAGASLIISACASHPAVTPLPSPPALQAHDESQDLDEPEAIPGVPERECVEGAPAASGAPLVICEMAELPTILAAVNLHRVEQYHFEMLESEMTQPTWRHSVSVTLDPRDTDTLIRGIEQNHRMRVDHLDHSKRVIYLRRILEKTPGQ